MFDKKYRPKEFKDIIGETNKIVARAIDGFIVDNNLSHSLLFTGPRGVGKTTIARIIANKLGCRVDGVNLLEINASDDRGIDKARSIISDSRYMPHIGDKKVFILDEAHQITEGFSEASLKLIEEPPEHVYFILCTSKPDKIDDALKSRLQAYKMAPCNSREIGTMLKKICEKEMINVSKSIINYISVNSEGIPREALISLHKISGLDESDALDLLRQDLADEENFKALIGALMDKSPWKRTRHLVRKCGNNSEKTRIGILSYISTCILNKDKVHPQWMLIHEAFNESFKPMGRDGFNGLIFACAMCANADGA